MMNQLQASQFAEFFEALYGYSPFPWQKRLAEHVTRTGTWPSILDLPTGTGKTAALDVAVFHLALQASATPRRAPMRIVYVVDRRTIVDQAYERARRVAKQLKDATSGILATVRDRLVGVSREGESPLQAILMRGGMPRSDAWAKSPDQPLIAVSTVDQVGSRLLFRGYGVSPSMRPIHAGLLGNDVLYLLDEVHLSAPFCATLEAIRQRYRNWGDEVPTCPFQVVQMSATPGVVDGEPFRLGDDDLANPVMRRRLETSKPAELREVSGARLAAQCEQEAAKFAARPGATVLVVVNRVQTAREVACRLSARADVRLVTGRMRPLDREDVETSLRERVCAGRVRSASATPLVVVATQCVEAGADFDFDALVTECASLDALRQRFGRLDRLGDLGRAPAVIVAAADTLGEDPAYGSALGQTWTWLKELPQVDFGSALPLPPADRLPGLLAPRATAPVLLPAHLDAWVQTSSEPRPDPDVALWLHGPERGTGDCQVVWRADVTEQLLRNVGDSDTEGEIELRRREVQSIVDSVPPASGEAMPVPFFAVSRWVRGLSESRVADVEGMRDEVDEDAGAAFRPFIVWRGDDSLVVSAADQVSGALRPGDTVVVPASYGGISKEGTWSPTETDPVRDIGDIASFRLRGRAALRMQRDVLHSEVGGVEGLSVPRPSEADEEGLDDRATVQEWLVNLGECATWPSDIRQVVRALQGRSVRVERVGGQGSEAYLVAVARRRVRFDADDISTEDDQSSFTGAEVTLVHHLNGVADSARDFGARAGLPSAVVEDVRLAGICHDLGKADERFQRLLHGGSRFRAEVAPEPLAKSARLLRARKERLEAARRSGYPRGARHELQSVALMVSSPALLARAHDQDLLLHLVASHHGRCRPFAPWVDDPDTVPVATFADGIAVSANSDHGLARLDSGVGTRFWSLVRKYGWWGLAWFEAVLRLGDHRTSEAEQRKDAAQ